ncbi:MAG: carboxypeptidase-like regulatory domain-containing protein, partial [Bryobacteraceae bacterium]
MNRNFRIILFAAALFSLLAISSNAQSTFGEIRGIVVDPTGAVIAGASVSAQNTRTGDTRKVSTD